MNATRSVQERRAIPLTPEGRTCEDARHPGALCDKSALIALFNETDKHHSTVRKASFKLATWSCRRVSSPGSTTSWLPGRGRPLQAPYSRYVASRVAAGRWEVPGIGSLLLAAHALLQDYPSIGLGDAMNVVLAREFRTDVIATLDYRHFRVIRSLTSHSTFRLLPADVP